MNRMQSLARIMLVGMGLFVAVKALPQLIMTLEMFVFILRASEPAAHWGVNSPSFMALIDSPIGLWIALYFLVYKSQDLALKIVPPAESEKAPMTADEWLPVAYRLVCLGTGLFLLYSTFWQIIGILNNLSFFLQHKGRSPASITNLLGLGLSLAIGLYLITGAGHFVQWHVRQTQKLCRTGFKTAFEAKSSEKLMGKT